MLNIQSGQPTRGGPSTGAWSRGLMSPRYAVRDGQQEVVLQLCVCVGGRRSVCLEFNFFVDVDIRVMENAIIIGAYTELHFSQCKFYCRFIFLSYIFPCSTHTIIRTKFFTCIQSLEL